MNRNLLILDLDETLVFASDQPGPSGPDFEVHDYYVRKRPHLGGFLECAFAWYDVAVWTSAGSIYADGIVSAIFPDPDRLRFVWDGRRCTIRRDLATRRFYDVKDLKKVKRHGFDLERVLMIDDTPEKLSRNYGNHLMLAPFEGDDADRDLVDVLPFLEWLSRQERIRSIEKRNWRSWAGPPDRPSS